MHNLKRVTTITEYAKNEKKNPLASTIAFVCQMEQWTRTEVSLCACRKYNSGWSMTLKACLVIASNRGFFFWIIPFSYILARIQNSSPFLHVSTLMRHKNQTVVDCFFFRFHHGKWPFLLFLFHLRVNYLIAFLLPCRPVRPFNWGRQSHFPLCQQTHSAHTNYISVLVYCLSAGQISSQRSRNFEQQKIKQNEKSNINWT